jgi:hypothetical protein
MTQTRSGKTFFELLVMVVVLLGLGGMLFHAVQKVRAGAAPSPSVRSSADTSVTLNRPHQTRGR